MVGDSIAKILIVGHPIGLRGEFDTILIIMIEPYATLQNRFTR